MKSMIAILLSLAMVCLMIPNQASADSTDLLDGSQLFSGIPQTLENAVPILLEGTGAVCDDDSVHVENGTVTITKAGCYQLRGSLAGQITVDAGKDDEVQLILDGVTITSQAAAIRILQAGNAVIVLPDGSSSQLSGDEADGVIYSEADLTLCGSGSLLMEGSAGDGIVSKGSLVVSGCDLTVNAAEHGVSAKDCIAIQNSSISITSGKDGIHVKNSKISVLGNLLIQGGTFRITSTEDAISASGAIQIDSGSFEITTGGGSAGAVMKPSDAEMGWGSFRQSTSAAADDESAKGIKAGGSILIKNGNFTLDCADDAVHSNANVTILGGQWSIKTADDGIHADVDCLIEDGSFEIPYCYEGIEGGTITINGGSIQITAVDDGMNASGVNDCCITINGGTITIISDGDCLDSNGKITLNGGTLKLTCNGYGNTAIDYETGLERNGGDVTTNDNSENGSGMRFGGHGGRGDRNPFGGFRDDRTQGDGQQPIPPQFEGAQNNGQQPFPPQGGMPDGFGGGNRMQPNFPSVG